MVRQDLKRTEKETCGSMMTERVAGGDKGTESLDVESMFNQEGSRSTQRIAGGGKSTESPAWLMEMEVEA